MVLLDFLPDSLAFLLTTDPTFQSPLEKLRVTVIIREVSEVSLTGERVSSISQGHDAEMIGFGNRTVSV